MVLCTWCSLGDQRIWQSGVAGSPRCSGWGGEQARGSSPRGVHPWGQCFRHGSCPVGFFMAMELTQVSLLIGRSPSECELQHFHQQLWFHCWDNYGEWVKTQVAISCGASLSPWNSSPLHWASQGGGESGVLVGFRWYSDWTFLLPYSMF